MLRDTPCKAERTLWVDGILVEFSLAYEGMHVSMVPFMQFFGPAETAGRLYLLLLL